MITPPSVSSPVASLSAFMSLTLKFLRSENYKIPLFLNEVI